VFITARPRQTCPITGRQAHYLDPRTGVPYADSNAYKVLTQILQHGYIWSPSLGCYVDQVEPSSDAMGDEKSRSVGQETMALDQDN
jgi:vacuolar protein sorting-associated protein 72